MADESSPAAGHQKSSRSCMLVKVLLASIIMAVSYRLSNLHTTATSQRDHQIVEKKGSMLASINVSLATTGNCDLFTGQWTPDPSGPIYTNSTCYFIGNEYNCMKNGRPDSGYLHWKWKPNGCDLPRFDGEKFLSSMRNKALAFVGDSVAGQQAESLLCLLSQVELPEIYYHTENWHNTEWHFPAHNFTLAQSWAPFLLKADTIQTKMGYSAVNLHLDILEKNWTTIYHLFDYIVISGGQWFYTRAVVWDNNKVIGCHYCPGMNLKELEPEYIYRRAIQLALQFLVTSDHKPHVLFRTWSPHHYENGDWGSGGVCNRTLPYKEGEFNGPVDDHVMRGIEIDEFVKAVAGGNGTNMKLMDIYHLSLLRPDAHPGPYQFFHPFDNKTKNQEVANDCSHWCLPGVIESWNEIVMEMTIKEASLRTAS